MQNIIAVFGNRNQAMQFATSLKRQGVRTKTIDTPRELSVACGISIIFESSHLGRARQIVQNFSLTTAKFFIISGDLFRKYMPISIF